MLSHLADAAAMVDMCGVQRRLWYAFLSGAEWPDDTFDYQGILPLFSTDDSEAISIS